MVSVCLDFLMNITTYILQWLGDFAIAISCRSDLRKICIAGKISLQEYVNYM